MSYEYTKEKIFELSGDVFRDLMFETNDEFTRKQVSVALTEIARALKITKEITDYVIVCDESNNLEGQRNMVADFYYKVTGEEDEKFHVINFETVKTGVEYKEIEGHIPA
jgi:hypothetical protein